MPKSIHPKDALNFHSKGKPGKLEISPTKPLATARDLSLAYSPGVAIPCLEIEKDPSTAYDYTSKGNTVAVISNGTAVLGLGNIGALASKPVMEGKAVLFKKFADIDGIDLEVNTEDADEFVNSVKVLSKTWGGINLEDIKAPECFIIEEKLSELLDDVSLSKYSLSTSVTYSPLNTEHSKSCINGFPAFTADIKSSKSW